MSQICRHCGGLVAGDHDQVAAWRIEIAERRLIVRANRVDEKTAADLLGISQRKLAELRKRGCGPVVSTLPVAGSRFSYELLALSQFKSAHRSGDEWD
jgi:hypothetical protein